MRRFVMIVLAGVVVAVAVVISSLFSDFDFDTGSHEVVVPPPITVANLPTVSVDPAGGLVDDQPITVTARGFDAGTTAEVAECTEISGDDGPGFVCTEPRPFPVRAAVGGSPSTTGADLVGSTTSLPDTVASIVVPAERVLRGPLAVYDAGGGRLARRAPDEIRCASLRSIGAAGQRCLLAVRGRRAGHQMIVPWSLEFRVPSGASPKTDDPHERPPPTR